MKFSGIKYIKDDSSFHMLKAMGARIFELDDLENTDRAILKLIKEDYKTIFITNEVAGFSSDVIKKYKHDNSVNIIIMREKRI